MPDNYIYWIINLHCSGGCPIAFKHGAPLVFVLGLIIQINVKKKMQTFVFTCAPPSDKSKVNFFNTQIEKEWHAYDSLTKKRWVTATQI